MRIGPRRGILVYVEGGTHQEYMNLPSIDPVYRSFAQCVDLESVPLFTLLDLRRLCSTISEGLHRVEIVDFASFESLRIMQYKEVVLWWGDLILDVAFRYISTHESATHYIRLCYLFTQCVAVPIEQCWYALVEGELDDRDRLTAGAIFQARLRAGLWNLLSILDFLVCRGKEGTKQGDLRLTFVTLCKAWKSFPRGGMSRRQLPACHQVLSLWIRNEPHLLFLQQKIAQQTDETMCAMPVSHFLVDLFCQIYDPLFRLVTYCVRFSASRHPNHLLSPKILVQRMSNYILEI